ncbi:MAG: hypothetical protein Q8R28_05740, partial [Dehalococcoidia bacterium]|nr:hypothetical protein [Dehalococcoidia bacterium]
RLILNRLSTNAFTATLQGAARTELDDMVFRLATYISAAGAAYSATVDPGGAARTEIETTLEDLGKVLAGAGGLTAYPAAAAPANGVSMAAALRWISDSMGTLIASGLAYIATVSTATSTVAFSAIDIAGKGNAFFVGWDIVPVWDAGGAGAAPQGEEQPCSAYISATGAFVHTAFTAQLAVTDKVLLIHPRIANLIRLIQGGAGTIQGVLDNQAAELDLARSPQSGSYSPVAGGAEMTLYDSTLDSITTAFVFHTFSIDMTNLLAGDSLLIKVYIKNVAGGAYTAITLNAAWTYAGAQVPAMMHFVMDLFNQYGVKVTGTMTGVTRALACEFFDSRRST